MLENNRNTKNKMLTTEHCSPEMIDKTSHLGHRKHAGGGPTPCPRALLRGKWLRTEPGNHCWARD